MEVLGIQHPSGYWHLVLWVLSPPLASGLSFGPEGWFLVCGPPGCHLCCLYCMSSVVWCSLSEGCASRCSGPALLALLFPFPSFLLGRHCSMQYEHLCTLCIKG